MVRQRHTFDPTIIRDNEIRGIYAKSLTLADAEVLGRAFGKYVRDKQGHRVALAFDGRESSPDLAVAVASGLKSSGLTVMRVGRGPTPMLCFAMDQLKTDAGIMITGSHLPGEWNGFKLFLGRDACSVDELVQIVATAAAGDFVAGEGAQEDGAVFPHYVANLLASVGDTAGSSVMWDPGNGATGEVIALITRNLDGDHYLANAIVDGAFPCHEPNPYQPAAVRCLKDLVVANACEIGFAFDGDGERLAVLDAAGKLVRFDVIAALLARATLREQPGSPIVVDIRSGQFLLEQILRDGGRPVFCRPTLPALKSAMAAVGAALGTLMDGRCIFAERRPLICDAIFAALRILGALRKSNVGLAALSNVASDKYYLPEIPVSCACKPSGLLAGTIGRHMSDCGAHVAAAESIRVTTDTGWWALWACEYTGQLIATLESRDAAGFEMLKRTVSDALAGKGLAVPELLAAAESRSGKGRRAVSITAV